MSQIEAYAMHGGYAFLLLISILEAIPLVGTTVPGHVVVILSGFLARMGIFNIWIVMALASFGAILGDTIGYYIGRKYGLRIIEKYKNHFFFKEEYIEKARSMIAKHTGKAVIIGRFNPFTRAFMPMLVGASHSSAKRFWIYNIIGGISWAVASVMVGYIFGYGYTAVVGYFGKAMMIAIVSAIIFAWGYRFVNARFHIFRKYELFVLALSMLSIWGVVESIQDAWAEHSFMAFFDIKVNLFMATHVTPFIAHIATFVTNLGGTVITGIIGLGVGIYFLYKHKWRSGAITLISLASTGLCVELMKAFFMRARPENALQLIVNDPSFPSGHASFAAALFLVLAYLFAPKFNSWVKRELWIVFCVLAAFSIGLSRIILNVHWSSDVIAGWSLGVFCATATILLVRYVGALIVSRMKKD